MPLSPATPSKFTSNCEIQGPSGRTAAVAALQRASEGIRWRAKHEDFLQLGVLFWGSLYSILESVGTTTYPKCGI